MVDLYIYYRVRGEHAAQLAPRVFAMQSRLGSGQLKRRPGTADGVQTWMEVYPGAAEGFDAVLAAAVQEARLPEFIQGVRHAEIFTDVDPCA